MNGRYVARLISLIFVLLVVDAGTGAAQRPLTPAEINGEWVGTLQLDNSAPRLSLVFRVTDSLFAGTVYADAAEMGPMEHGTIKGDTVHFNLDRYDFTGVVSRHQMQLALIVWNGSTRRVTLTKQPDPPKPPADPLRSR